MPTPRAGTGTYVLHLQAHRERCIQVGQLGTFMVKPGTYLYVGSAFGPGGVQARVQRHARSSTSMHWHVDYLRAEAELSDAWITFDAARRECAWAGILAEMTDDPVPLRGFGASDCSCNTHLFFFETAPSLASFRGRISKQYANHAPIKELDAVS